jgi:hypothetical protein
LELYSLCIKNVRFLAVDAVKKNSSKPGEWLLGQDTVNTAPVETLEAYRDLGEAKARLEHDPEESDRMFR